MAFERGEFTLTQEMYDKGMMWNRVETDVLENCVLDLMTLEIVKKYDPTLLSEKRGQSVNYVVFYPGHHNRVSVEFGEIGESLARNSDADAPCPFQLPKKIPYRIRDDRSS